MQIGTQIWKIYLDTCCLSRFFDDQTQTRVCRETEAIDTILDTFRSGQWEWVVSKVLEIEVGRNLNFAQYLKIKSLLTRANQTVLLTETEELRGEVIRNGRARNDRPRDL